MVSESEIFVFSHFVNSSQFDEVTTLLRGWISVATIVLGLTNLSIVL